MRYVVPRPGEHLPANRTIEATQRGLIVAFGRHAVIGARQDHGRNGDGRLLRELALDVGVARIPFDKAESVAVGMGYDVDEVRI